MEETIFQNIEEHQLLKVIISVVIGALLGLEREYRHKAAGMRTLTLICMGSTLFTILSVELGFPGSPDRVASNILTGVGFIGAGVIFKGDFSIDGITTAATIWIASALGIAIGCNHYLLAGFSLAIVILLLIGLKLLEKRISGINEKRVYNIQYHMDHCSKEEVPGFFKRFGLQYKQQQYLRKESLIEEQYEVTGHLSNIEELNSFLLHNNNISHFRVQTNPL